MAKEMKGYVDGIYHAKNGNTEYLIRVEDEESKECFHLPETDHTNLSFTSSFWSSWGEYTPATPEQETWLKTCIEKGHFVPLYEVDITPKIQDSYEIF